jgi:predicted ATPase
MEERYLIEIKLKRDEIDSFNTFPFCLNGIKSLETIKLNPAVTFFIGENGSGKSTLLEAIAVVCGFNPEGGTKNFKFGTRESHSNLWKYIRLSRSYRRPKDGFFLRAESFFNVATEIERLDSEFSFGPPVINSYGGVSLHEQSHGESFWSLVMNRFGGNGIYILDEPEAALSPSRQMALITRIHDLVLKDSQFIISTHSPILMSYPNATLYQIGENGISEMDYTETEHFLVTKEFLNNHERMLRVLMDE